jgi:hypothetical protein
VSEIWKALLEVQKEAPALQRDGLNPHFKSSYVTLETVMQTVLPILNRHGLVVVQATTGDDELRTKLVHAESGEYEESYMRLRISKDDAHGYGSAVTYARRYAIMGMLGLVADADDDGNAASKPPPSRSKGTKAPDPASVLPTSWAELEAAMAGYGQQTWDDWRAVGVNTRNALFPDAEGQALSAEQKQALWEINLAAAQWLMVKFDPAKFPPPSREEIGDAWAFALGGRS